MGFNGLGCYRCVLKDIFILENACIGVVCILFDNQRLSALGADGKLPPLPVSSGVGGAGGVVSVVGFGGLLGSAGVGGITGIGKACSDVGKKGGTIVYVTGSSAV